MQTIPPRLFSSQLPTGSQEFFCYIQFDTPPAKLTWQIRSSGEALVSGTVIPSDQKPRLPIAAVLPPTWNGGELCIQAAGETASFTIHHLDQSQRYQWPVAGLSLIVGSHRLGEVHRLAWQIYSQQFAWDIVPLSDPLWSVLAAPLGDQLHAQDFSCFGAAILAPAGGKIIQAASHHPDRLNAGEPPDPAEFLKDFSLALGNHIVIDHGDQVYSLLAHLQQNSVLVAVGERVEAGQVLAKLGNSGASSGPHLHFHFMGGPDPLTASPLPIRLDIEGEVYAPQAGELIMRE